MSDKFFPGWKMTPAQHLAYFRLLAEACEARGITSSADRETLRQTIHQRAFGRKMSAKDIDHMKGFDALKAACLAESRPADMDAQLAQVQQPVIRWLHSVRSLADEPYLEALARSPRFKKSGLEDSTWNEVEREQFRNTVANRMNTKGKSENPF